MTQIMLVVDDVEMKLIVKTIISDLKLNKIRNFGDWLNHYKDTIDEVEEFVNDYCIKIAQNRLDEIEQWQKVIMLNAVALYMIEWDTEEIPIGMMNQILKIFVRTIAQYSHKTKGYMNLHGDVFISDISLCKFTDVNEDRKDTKGNNN